MSGRELDAAGIRDPGLRAAFESCRRLNAAHGRTYYLATLLLPPAKRPFVHALYGFARFADEFVDSLTDPHPELLEGWSKEFLAAWDSDPVGAAGRHGERPSPTSASVTGPGLSPVSLAAIATAFRWGIPKAHFEAFLASMGMDITVGEYPTYRDLEEYMYGSAAVIGLQMLPILEPLQPEAADFAATLGIAFQLTNFIRDVGEDLDRGRIYLPLEDLTAFGVSRQDLLTWQANREVPRPLRELLRFEIARTRDLYRQAAPGIGMLDPTSRDCVSAALMLYRGILDAIEESGFRVLTGRARVSRRRRLAVALPRLAAAYRAR